MIEYAGNLDKAGMLYMSLESRISSLKAHPLIQVLADNRGNPRTLVLIEPLWGVPYNLIAPFATLYMYTQGITDAVSYTHLAVRPDTAHCKPRIPGSAPH